MEPITRSDTMGLAARRLQLGRILVGKLATIKEFEGQREPFSWRETGIESINHDLSVSDRLRRLDALYADVDRLLDDLRQEVAL